MRKRKKFVLVGVLAVLAGFASGWRTIAGAAEGASTLTPDELTFLVSKDVGVERWVVSLNLSPSDPSIIANVTGNVFKSDGSPPSFVVCRPRADSTGTLADPASSFRFVCDGADACATTARECARTGWRRIADDVPLPAQFFLPDGGLAAAPAPGGILGRLASAVAGLRGWTRLSFLQPPAAVAQANDRGATLSFDGLSYLVNKDLAGERWSIGLNYVPVRSAAGGVVEQVGGITGNVLRGDDVPPTFISCTVREDSTGTLDDPSSSFRLSCSGADGCTTTATECAQSGWNLISDDVSIPASFFLPPDGLPATPQSDPEIVVIGRTSDPPSYETADYTTGSASRADAPAGIACPAVVCFADRIGACTGVEGRLVESGGECLCRVDDVDPACITCGDGASGQCGGDCEFPVGDATARGVCLPESSGSTDCICYGIGAGSALEIESCGGPLAGQCPEGRCCTDDPSDGCASDGAASCAGLCVAGTCDDAGDACGTCFVIGSVPTPGPTPVPTVTPVETGSPSRTPAPTTTPRPSVTPPPTTTPAASLTPVPTGGATSTPKPSQTAAPTQTPQPTATPVPSCGDGRLDEGEQCDPNRSGTGCPGQRCSGVTCECFSCTPQTLRLDGGTDSTVSYDVGISVGTFDFTYTGFESEPDRFIVRSGGKLLFDSGCGVQGSTVAIELAEISDEVEVEVDAACDGSGGGSWEYTVECPR